MPTTPESILGLDVGGKRIGVAIASANVRLPRPLTTLIWGDDFMNELENIIKDENAVSVIVGLPRGLEGQHTAQTVMVEDFVKELRQRIKLPVHIQDEALTSQKAEKELAGRGKPYNKEDIDALAATYILEDWLAEHKEVA